MSNGDDENSEMAVNVYRLKQLEVQQKQIQKSADALSFGQIKQMCMWLGLPVIVATGVFGVALWQTLESSTKSAAEKRAAETVGSLTSEIDRLEARIRTLQGESEEVYSGLREIRARADESARAVRRQADNAEARATDAARALAELQRTAASATDIQQALGNVDQIAEQIASNSDFQKIVSETALADLRGMVVAFDQSKGCPVGWSEFQEAAGRMIIGVGEGSIDRIGDQDIPLTERRWRDFGGAESHILTDTEMPRHNHILERKIGVVRDDRPNRPKDNGFSGRSADISTHRTSATTFAGESKAHNNMPPYLALYFCKKNL